MIYVSVAKLMMNAGLPDHSLPSLMCDTAKTPQSEGDSPITA